MDRAPSIDVLNVEGQRDFRKTVMRLSHAELTDAEYERALNALDELAARSGVSRRLVVQIEQGEANPSIGTLLRLADALEVTLTDLVSDHETTAFGVRAASEATELWCRGTLVLEVADESVQVKAGHSAWFDASRQHAYRNTATTPLTFTLVVYDPA